jgi:hypothetical protein
LPGSINFISRPKITIEKEHHKIKLKFCEIEILGLFCTPETVDVVQLVRMSDCGSEGRGFESHLPPKQKRLSRHEAGQPFLFVVPPSGIAI